MLKFENFGVVFFWGLEGKISWLDLRILGFGGNMFKSFVSNMF